MNGSADEVLKFLKESQLDLLFWVLRGTDRAGSGSPGRMPRKDCIWYLQEEEPVNVSSVPHPAFALLLKKPDEDYLEDIL